ncbi:long-chain-fatty-acid--CoA ligase [Desulfotomaculum copahuensis]|uniref:Long-chain-fatty-acid--CoA ligase n=1 Tax=Desulfotomaculum copahuensis TaxID=1838280 RepID=A0A1B7LKK2_9FIRM|nr:long-chain fatty acid--CoA ligase [Desulfotomaculum copahuensis]OAT87089.1 long-chain-fatty-acid--CoA ligase [Desulfotomaculum copahuensis]
MDSPPGALPWLSAYDPDVPARLDYPDKPVFALLKENVRRHAERTALIFYGKKISYGQLGGYVDRLAGALKQLGTGPGDRVALILPNCPQYVIAYYAVLQLGAVVVPVNPLSTERELTHIVRDAGVRLAIALNLLAGRMENVRTALRDAGSPLLEQVIYASMPEFLPFPLNLLYLLKQKSPPACRHGLRFRPLLNGSPALACAASADVRRAPAVLIYTGGTTGKPKGVMLSHYALVVNAWQCRAWVNTAPADRLLAVLPIFHGFGMSVCMNSILLSGGAAILLPRYQPGEILKAVHRHRPTLFAGVPTMFTGLINQPDLSRYDLSSLRGCFSGAASLPPEIKRRFEELTGGRLMEGYGLTEAVTAKCANPYRGVNKTGSIGVPFPDTVMRIVDAETGARELPPGEVGEIVLKSPDIMLGYYGRPEETAAVVRDGWLYTGDLGYMDADGYFYLVERKKDLIITGGFNVYPREVEDVLYMHPAVKEACVIGVPDGYRGETVVAFIVLRENAAAGADELIAFCRQNLLPYKVPRRVEFCPELPKSAIGKVLRRVLREKAGDYK